MCNNMIITASFDHYVVTWDFKGLSKRITEKALMREEDIESRRIEVYNRAIDEKRQRGGGQKRAGGAGTNQKKKAKKGK